MNFQVCIVCSLCGFRDFATSTNKACLFAYGVSQGIRWMVDPKNPRRSLFRSILCDRSMIRVGAPHTFTWLKHPCRITDSVVNKTVSFRPGCRAAPDRKLEISGNVGRRIQRLKLQSKEPQLSSKYHQRRTRSLRLRVVGEGLGEGFGPREGLSSHRRCRLF